MSSPFEPLPEDLAEPLNAVEDGQDLGIPPAGSFSPPLAAQDRPALPGTDLPAWRELTLARRAPAGG
jgi:hypothetical protein